MQNLKDIRLFLLDMDGTIYLDNDLFDGTLEFLDYVKSIGGRCMFLTNNSSKSVDKYIDKLASLGIKAEYDDFFTSTQATEQYLKEHGYIDKKLYALGTTSFKEELKSNGFKITDELEDDIDCLVMGFDTELSFQKLEDACILLGRGVDYIATNPDWVCPTWYGYVPDCGSISQILCTATHRKPLFIGKPQPDMALLAISKAGYKKEQAMMIGDRIYTDVACGVNAGIANALVLSGETTQEDVEKSDVKPMYIFKDIKEILNTIKSL